MTGPHSALLDRRLGPLDAAAIVISNVIGVGIFTTPGFVATLLPNKAATLAVWAIGGALALAGALAYAELAARRPQAGGEYVYLRESFGGFAAFLTGWTSFVAGFAGAIAAGGVGVAAYLDHFVPGAGNATAIAAWHLGPLALTLSVRALVAIAVIAMLALIQARGVGPGRVVQNALTLLKVGALVSFVVIGLIVARPRRSERRLSWFCTLRSMCCTCASCRASCWLDRSGLASWRRAGCSAPRRRRSSRPSPS